MIYILLLFPLLTSLLCLLIKNKIMIEILNTIGVGTTFSFIISFAYRVYRFGAINEDFWYVDGLSMYLLLIIGLISFLAAIYSINYMTHEMHERHFTLGKLQSYYILFHIFFDTMILVCITNNLGMMWIAIEGTTLVSAFLVGFYNDKTSIEAAWKYILICSAGIGLAFLGTNFVLLSSVNVLGHSEDTLNWTVLVANATSLNGDILKIAFILIFIGYGTKVGLVPMHTWLPDAHSQAPTPISALLSGVLLNVAMYGVLRFHIIISKAIGTDFSSKLFLIFGLISLIIAAAFIISSKDYKRLLAYHSIEHMGIISIGIGIGGVIGIFGGIFHLFNHAITKSFLFFGAGNILQKYKTRNIEIVKGIVSVMPATATLFMIGMFALTGNPPFSIFASELTIIDSMIIKGQYAIAAIFIFVLVAIFAGFVSHAASMVFGKVDESTQVEKGEMSKINVMIMVVLVIIIIYIGIYIPDWFNTILTSIVGLF
jgi:hydrogenase-4 component F